MSLWVHEIWPNSKAHGRSTLVPPSPSTYKRKIKLHSLYHITFYMDILHGLMLIILIPILQVVSVSTASTWISVLLFVLSASSVLLLLMHTDSFLLLLRHIKSFLLADQWGTFIMNMLGNATCSLQSWDVFIHGAEPAVKTGLTDQIWTQNGSRKMDMDKSCSTKCTYT